MDSKIVFTLLALLALCFSLEVQESVDPATADVQGQLKEAPVGDDLSPLVREKRALFKGRYLLGGGYRRRYSGYGGGYGGRTYYVSRPYYYRGYGGYSGYGSYGGYGGGYRRKYGGHRSHTVPHHANHPNTPHIDPPHVDPPHVNPPHVDPPHVDPPHVNPPQIVVP